MDIWYWIIFVAIVADFYGITKGQEDNEIGSHFISKVINGKTCNTRVRFSRKGNVKQRFKGKVLLFTCFRGTKLIGERYLVCVDGAWSHPKPVCAYGNCPLSDGESFKPPGVQVQSHMVNTKVVGFTYSCPPDHTLEGGDDVVYCTGSSWQGKVPKACILTQDFTCDFENVTSPHCNWTSEFDNGVGWKRHSEETLLEGTGPDYDHTFEKDGTGHYMYVDSMNAPEGSVAVLYSPWQNAEATKCLQFWYHMHGNQTNSTLAVAIQKQFSGGFFEPLWMMEGSQGDQWQYAAMPLPNMQENHFRVLFLATINTTDNSDIAIDDVSIVFCHQVSTVATETTEQDVTTTRTIQTTSVEERSSSYSYDNETTNEVVTDMTTSQVTIRGAGGIAQPLKSGKGQASKNKTPLAVGLVGGCVLAVAGLVIGVYLVKRRRQSSGDADQDTRAFAYTSMGSDIPL